MSEEKNSNLSFGSRTDVGLARPHNEDSLVASPPLFAVADGMGGHEAGEVASEVAVQTLAGQAPKDADAHELGRAVVAANHAVIRAAETGIGKPGMGTTMTAAVVQDTHLVLAQVGDSRAYLLHSGVLSRLTRDHSLVADMVENGEISEEEARWHPQRSVITRALGSNPGMLPDLYEFDLESGDRLLLCSDGLHSMVDNDELLRELNAHPDPQECADSLIEAACKAGGHDNITAIVIDIGSQPEPVQQKKDRRKSRRIACAVAAAFVCLIALACFFTYSYARSQAYLIDEGGRVVVYRGLKGSAGPIKLSWYDHTTAIEVDKLPGTTAQSLAEGIQEDSLDSANALVSEWEAQISEVEQEESSDKDSSSSSSGSSSNSEGANAKGGSDGAEGSSADDAGSGSSSASGNSGSQNGTDTGANR